MIRLLIGPLVVAAGYAAGSYYGSDCEQLVHKSPSATYGAVEQALGNIRQSGTSFFDGGRPVAYEIQVERTPDRKLVVSLLFDGKQGAETDIDFLPRDNGASTLVQARIHADRNVLREVLAGTSRARLAYAPDWMLNLTFRPVLQQLAAQIEEGQLAKVEGLSGGDAQGQWESSLSNEQRSEVAEWRREEATRPSTDLGGDTPASN